MMGSYPLFLRNTASTGPAMPAPAMMTFVFDMTVLCEGVGVGWWGYLLPPLAHTPGFYTHAPAFQSRSQSLRTPAFRHRLGGLGNAKRVFGGLWAPLGRVSRRIYQLHPQLRLTRKRCSSTRRSLAKSDAIALVI